MIYLKLVKLNNKLKYIKQVETFISNNKKMKLNYIIHLKMVMKVP